MIKYTLRRLVSILITLIVASMVIFILTQILPGDVAQMILGQYATPESLHALRETLGLYAPLYLRYYHWMNGIMHGNLGMSLAAKGIPISGLLINRAENSLFLAFWASLFVIPLSLLLGALAGLKQDTWVDRIVSLSTMVAISLPEFVSGVFLILIFSITFGWLPSSSNIDPNVSLWLQWRALILPIVTLSLVILGYIARMTRASVIDVASSNYARTAILKGLRPSQVLFKHVLRNALLPSVTVIAMNVGWMIGGLVVVESVFAFPGLGSLLLFAINQRDVPLIQDAALFVVAAYMLLNLIADIMYQVLNPKLRYE